MRYIVKEMLPLRTVEKEFSVVIHPDFHSRRG